MIYLENLIDALITTTTHPLAGNQTYLVTDRESVSTPELIRRLARVLGKRCLIFPFPLCIIRLIAKLLRRSEVIDRLTQSLSVDSTKIHRELGWEPPYTMEQGLKNTAEWYLKSHA